MLNLIQQFKWGRLLINRPRLFSSILVGICVFVVLNVFSFCEHMTRVILAWDSVAFLYIILAIHMMYTSSSQALRKRAQNEHEGRRTILILTSLASLTSLMSIIKELSVIGQVSGWEKIGHLAIAGSTILLSWTFTHLMFALYYAHSYTMSQLNGHSPGLDFPGNEAPSYSDFVYFSFIIGVAGQTADVDLTTREIRKIGTFHCILAFFFNTTILALMVNMAASAV